VAATQAMSKADISGKDVLSAILCLRQLCIHPSIFVTSPTSTYDGAWANLKKTLQQQAAHAVSGPTEMNSAKFGVVGEILRHLKGDHIKLDNRVVIMTYFTSVK
jgi:hypothetical protein